MLEKGYPSLWLFDAGGKNHVPYNGPRDLESLVEFVNSHTGRGPPNVKVCKCKVILSLENGFIEIKDISRFNFTFY